MPISQQIFTNFSKEYSTSNMFKGSDWFLFLDIQRKLKKNLWVSPFQKLKKESNWKEEYLKRNEAHNIERPSAKFDFQFDKVTKNIIKSDWRK